MTNIEWTDITDNIIVVEGGGWWCRMISEGCVNCYAAQLNLNDFFGGNKLAYTGEPPKLRLREDIIDGWKTQRTPRKHFVASMTDVFGDWVPWSWALRFLRGMWCAPKQTFQVLTKRPQFASFYIRKWLEFDGLSEVPSNIWIGASVENQRRADERIPHLLGIPAVRFLSVEPMLEGIDLRFVPRWALPKNFGAGIHWVIFGGESGTKARPCNIDWIRDGVRQCRAAGVAPFVKQLGANVVLPNTSDCKFPKDKKGGNPDEWPEDLRVREFPSLARGPQRADARGNVVKEVA